MRSGVALVVAIEVLAFIYQAKLGILVPAVIAVGLLGTAVSLWIVYEVLLFKAQSLPAHAVLLMLGMLVIDAAGNLLGWYEYFWLYDVFVHFISGFVAAVVMVAFLERLSSRYGWQVSNRVWWYLAWLSAIAGGVGFEVVEYAIDLAFGTERWLGSGGDTVTDLIAGTIGAGVGMVLSVSVRRKEQPLA